MIYVTNLITEIMDSKPICPSQLYGDNMGTIFLEKNLSVGQQTKHNGLQTPLGPMQEVRTTLWISEAKTARMSCT